jgi:hypothetical protein
MSMIFNDLAAPVRRAVKIKAILAILLALAIAAGWSARAAADEWEQVPSTSGGNGDSAPEQPADSYAAPGAAPQADAARRTFIACGEKARDPSPQVAAIVAQIDSLWSANVRVYASVAPEPPHALAGGCIFYNETALLSLLGGRLDLRDPKEFKPMLYAIFAHEVGHEYHHDFSAARASTPNRIKELEADRFAGYTLEELNVPASGLAPYWSLAGDEFGAGPKHGTSTERVAAFREGWELAKWDRPENSKPVTSATDEPVAPDDSAGAP